MFKPLSSFSKRVANLIIPQQNRTGIEDWYHKSRCVAPMNRCLAHVRQDKDGSFVIHNLEEHLHAVADLSGEFASTFGYPDWGQLAGLWHDLGKYSLAFQSYIARGSGFDPEAHIEGGKGRVNHSWIED